MSEHSSTGPFPTELGAIVERVFAELGEAVAEQAHGFHWPVVATVDAAGDPQARTVVLRRATRSAGEVAFHTDRRAPKVAEIAARPRIALLFYDGRLKLQARATCLATVERDGERADAAWAGIGAGSRRCYLAPAAPSSVATGPSPNLPAHLVGRVPDAGEVEGGRVNFAVVRCVIERLDVLRLDHAGHRRARFDLDRGEVTASCWLEP